MNFTPGKVVPESLLSDDFKKDVQGRKRMTKVGDERKPLTQEV